jgi:hypothetical protein
VTKYKPYGNNINCLLSVMMVAHIPINLKLRWIGVNKITISKRYCIVEFDNGRYIFINNYYDYDDICKRIKLELVGSFLLPHDIVSEVMKSFKGESKTIKEIIKNFRVGTGDQFH